MKTEEARKLVAQIPAEIHEQFEEAHFRYLHFADVTSGYYSVEQVAQDREKYSHLFKVENGVPVLSGEDAAEFMSSVAQLPYEQCLAWDFVDFIDTHGEDALTINE